MTIDTKMWRWAVAVIALALAIAWMPRDAQAKPLSRDMRAVVQQGPPGAKVVGPNRVAWPRLGVTVQVKASWGDCIGKWVCLFENGHGGGRMIFFAKPGRFKLKAWSMGPDPAHHRGVSSYWNRRGGRALLWGPNYRHNAAPGRHNLPSDINDRSSYIQLF